MSSIHDKLERVRKPRVHIKYEVETEAGQVHKELPFVVGVIGDFSAHSAAVKPFKDRKFVKIDRDNFNDVMAKFSPTLNLSVENAIAADGSEMKIQLAFNRMEDFEPTQITEQVPLLRQLLATRSKLSELLTKTDRSCELEAILEKALQDKTALLELARALGVVPTYEQGEK